MEALRIEHISKNFDGVQAIHDVSLSVETGERLAIIGPNGAGKTTLFNLLNGQLRPTEGRIYLFNQDITQMSTQGRAHLGQARSFQINTLFPTLSILDNMLLACHGLKPSRFQMFRAMISYGEHILKAQEILQMMGLWEKRGEPAQSISYGEQRKMEIALSLASDPKLLLLDEPSAGLTAEESADLVEMITNLGRDMTVLVVAHDMDLVFGLADRIVVLHYGQIIVEGDPQVIQSDPRVKEIYMGLGEGSGDASLI